MKNIFLSFTIISLLFLLSCKKTETDEQQGVKFNLLLKTVKKLNAGNNITTSYSYNAKGEIAEIKTVANLPGGSEASLIKYFRNISGTVDSITYSGTTNSNVSFTEKTTFKYNSGGKLFLSIHNIDDHKNAPIKDSSIYNYTGNVLEKRVDYRSFNAGATSVLLRQANYTFDASGNLTTSIFRWPAHPSIDTLTFEYDSKVNSNPVWTDFFYWAPFFYNDYKPANNLTQTLAKNLDSFSYFDYTYSPNNKPLYRKEKVIGGTGFTETFYYYD